MNETRKNNQNLSDKNRRFVLQVQASFSLLVNSQAHIFTHLPNHMSINILISPYTRRIKTVHDSNKIIKFGICVPQFGRCERVRFRPVWPTVVPNGDRFESSKKFAVWDREPVWPVGRRKWKAGCQELPQKKRRILLVLDNANPTRPPSKSRTKPYIVPCGDAYFDREVWPNSVRIFIFFSEIFMKFGEKSAGILVRDSPLCCILWVLRKRIII